MSVLEKILSKRAAAGDLIANQGYGDIITDMTKNKGIGQNRTYRDYTTQPDPFPAIEASDRKRMQDYQRRASELRQNIAAMGPEYRPDTLRYRTEKEAMDYWNSMKPKDIRYEQGFNRRWRNSDTLRREQMRDELTDIRRRMRVMNGFYGWGNPYKQDK